MQLRAAPVEKVLALRLAHAPSVPGLIVNDCFALLNEPRRPWLDPEKLKQKFLTLSTQLHPDRAHALSQSEKLEPQNPYAEINAAYNLLRDPKERLLHFLQLELGEKPKDVQRIPPDLISIFNEINHMCRQADALLAEKSAVTSPMLMVQMFDKSQECTEKLAVLQGKVISERETLLEQVRKIDSEWNIASAERVPMLQRLEELYRLLSYFSRWSNQLQERIVRLAL